MVEKVLFYIILVLGTIYLSIVVQRKSLESYPGFDRRAKDDRRNPREDRRGQPLNIRSQIQKRLSENHTHKCAKEMVKKHTTCNCGRVN